MPKPSRKASVSNWIATEADAQLFDVPAGAQWNSAAFGGMVGVKRCALFITATGPLAPFGDASEWIERRDIGSRNTQAMPLQNSGCGERQRFIPDNFACACQ